MLAGHFEIKHFRDKSASLGFGIKMLHFNLEFYLMIFSAKNILFLESTWKVHGAEKIFFFWRPKYIGSQDLQLASHI